MNAAEKERLLAKVLRSIPGKVDARLKRRLPEMKIMPRFEGFMVSISLGIYPPKIPNCLPPFPQSNFNFQARLIKPVMNILTRL